MRSIGTVIAGSFGVALILLIAIGILAIISFRQLQVKDQSVIHSYLVIETLRDVITKLDDAETGQRGFIITGKEEFLAPYVSSEKSIGLQLKSLSDLVKDNSGQQDKLDKVRNLVDSKFSELRETIQLRRGPGGFAAARALVATNRGKLIMDNLRTLIAEMEQEEQHLLNQRSSDARTRVQTTYFLIVLGVPISFLILGALSFTLTRRIANPLARLSAAAEQIAEYDTSTEISVEQRRDEIGVLQRSFRDMQQRVQERTAALQAGNEALRQSEERFRLMVESVKDYAIILLDTKGNISSWNVGAERIKGYTAEEIIGKSFSVFYTSEDIAVGKPQNELDLAKDKGRFEDESWRVRKDGSRFWASVIITPLYTPEGDLFGYVKVTRDISERRQAEEQMKALNVDLEQRTMALETSNKELEAFSYSVAHDLRSPLRSMDGFSKYLLEHSAERLKPQELDYLHRIRAAAQRLGRLIDDLLNLARISRIEPHVEQVNLSNIASEIIALLQRRDPERQVTSDITPSMIVQGDRALLRIALEHLLENAWKFTGKQEEAQISFGVKAQNEEKVYYISDNGVGFDMTYIDKLFQPFQRLHTEEEFTGAGIGLALIKRIIQRHRGRIWAEAIKGQGATFYFTLGEENL